VFHSGSAGCSRDVHVAETNEQMAVMRKLIAQGQNHQQVLASFVSAAGFLGWFVRWQLVAPHPMLPMKYFADRRFSVGSGVITTSFFMLFGWFFLFGLYLQFARG